MDWDKLRIFHAAAAAGSFTHAGDALHMSQSAVSRQVSALERDLKVALFHRHARGLVLTEQGELLYATVAEVMTKQTGEPTTAATDLYRDDALPPADYIDGLRGATAVVTMRGLGTFSLELFADEAPVTVAVFARHAERGGYDGTTWHRVVPNFVLQGGSPGAHEMDGAVGPYMRDELGLTRHLRGTLGISTRGRDTGDAQIFINLVDNFRLDHQYTVFARITSGMDVVDRILEGDVIEGVEIRRRR